MILPGYENQKILFCSRKHFFYFLRSAFLLLPALLLPIAITVFLIFYSNFESATLIEIIIIANVALILFSLTLILDAFLRFYYSLVFLTAEKLVIINQEGMVNRQVLAIPLQNVFNVTAYSNGFLPTIFNYGEIILELNSPELKNLTLEFIKNPISLTEVIVKFHNQASKSVQEGKILPGPIEEFETSKIVTEFSTKEVSAKSGYKVIYRKGEKNEKSTKL